MSFSPAARQRWRVAGLATMVVAMLVAVLTLAPTSSVQAQAAPATCYGINDNDGNLITLSAGAVASLGFTGLADAESLAANNDAQELWTYDDATTSVYSFIAGQATPNLEFVWAGGDLDGLTFVNHNDGNPANDQLWGVIRNGLNDDVNVADEIVQIDPATGAELGRATFADPGAGSDEYDDLDGLVWQPVTGDIYSVIGGDTSTNRLITLNPSTGAILTSVDIAPVTTDIEGLASDLSGNLYGITGEDLSTPNNFYSISAAGAIANITSVVAGGVDFEGIACLEPLPVNITPATCYTIDEGNGNDGDIQHLIEIAIAADGTLTLDDLGQIPTTNQIENLAYRNGFAPDSIYVYNPPTDQLLTLDETDGTQITQVAINAALGDIDGLTFAEDDDADVSNDELWGIIRNGAPALDQIVGIDPTTGAIVSGPTTIATPAGAQNDDVDGLTWDVTTGNFYAVIGGNATSNQLITVEPTTGAVTVLGDTGIIDLEGLGSDGNGQLFAVTGEDGGTPENAYVIDKADGSALLLGSLAPTGYVDFESIDCSGASIPENPVIGLAKDLTAGPTETLAGDWSLDFTFNIENLGNVDLTDITLADSFDEYAAAGSIVAGPNVVSDDCPVTLAVGATCTIVWTIRVDVPPGDYNNSATVTGTSPADVDVSDISDDGIEPDTDGDGNPNEPGENDPTPASIPEDPVIGLAKDLTAGPTENGAGNYDIEFSFLVENLGDVDLSNITLVDTFAEYAAAGSIVSGPNVVSDNCPGTLTVGATCDIVWAIEVDVPPGNYNNSATVTGTSPLATDVSDTSDDGVEPDADGDGNPDEPGENDPTPANIPDDQVIGLAKQLTSGPTENGAGNWDLEFTFNVENFGNTTLTNLTLTDPFTEYAAAGSIVSGPNVVSDNCPVTLAVAGTCTIVWSIEVDVPAGTYNNRATITGESPAGGITTDDSTDGAEPDPNGDDLPNENAPTPAVIPEGPVIGLAKDLTAGPTQNGANNYDLEFTFLVENLGDVDLTGISLVDTFDEYAAAGSIVAGPSVVSDNCPATLVPAATCTIVWAIEVDVPPGTYNNSATVTGTSPASVDVTDISDDGVEPDADGDGNPDEPGENDPTPAIVPPLNQAVLGDLVFNDLNRDGVQDPGEPGIGGVNVEVFPVDGAGMIVGPAIMTTTDADGAWSVTVDPGDYRVQFDIPAGASGFSPQDAAPDAIDSDPAATGPDTGLTGVYSVAAGENNPTVDAGIVFPVLPASVGDFVWNDINGNGLQDAGEPGLEGVLVEILDAGGAVVGSDTTAGDGSYLVDNLAPGTYTARFTSNVSGPFSPQDAGDDTLDSDVSAGGVTAAFTLAEDEFNDTIDAGIVVPPLLGSISNFVFEDLNENGLQDDGEPGVANVTVIVRDGGGAIVGTDVTGDNGFYAVTDLPADTYVVEFVPPAGRQFTAADAGDDSLDSDADPATGLTAPVALAAGENNDTIDAGILPPPPLPGSISDFVFEDTNVNGVQDAGEPGVQGVTVILRDSGGLIVDSDTTDITGAYLFDNLPAGDYTVEFVLPAGREFTLQDVGDDALDSDADPLTGATGTIALAEGEDNDTIDAGVRPVVAPELGSISDFVFLDENENGLQDAGEPGVANVVVTVRNAAGAVIGTDTTAADGSYLVDGLPAGDYTVEFTLPGALEFTTQDVGDDALDSDPDPTTGLTSTVSLGEGEDNDTVDAGVRPADPLLVGSISDFVWDDLNGNGLQDAGEPGVANVTVTVRDEVGTVVGIVTTGADGSYSVGNLPAGTYTVEFTPPGDLTFTVEDAGADDGLDSDVDPLTGLTPPIVLAPGEDNDSVDAGLMAPPPPENPVIGLAKDLTSGPTLNDDGNYEMTFSFLIENLGDVDLANIALTDDFATTFPGATIIDGPDPVGGTCSVEAALGTAALAVGESCVAVWEIEVAGLMPGTEYLNTASVTGMSPGGETVEDISDDGTDTDANDNGDPGDPDEDDPTPIVIPENPVIGLAKDLVAGPTPVGTNTFAMSFSYIIENLGDVDLTNISLADDFNAVFAPGTLVSGPTPNGGDCSAEVAAGTAALAVGESCTAVWDVVITGVVQGTTYDNTATATGDSPNGVTVQDISDDGIETDPDGNGDPSGPDEDDPTPVLIPVVDDDPGAPQCTTNDGEPLSGSACPPILEYPGPFNNVPSTTSAFTAPNPVPSETAPLALTGGSAGLLSVLAIAMMGLGGAMMIGLRHGRRRDDEAR